MDNKPRGTVKVFGGTPLIIICVIAIALLAILPMTGVITSNGQRYLLKIFLYCALGIAWNLMSGYTGMTSLGQQSFIGIAGYALCVVTTTYHLGYAMGFFVGAVIAGVISLGLAVILFRMRGMYFAIATWVVAEALKTWFTSWSYVNMGGGMSVTVSPYPRTGSIYYMALVLVIAAFIVVYFLLKSKIGLGLTAMRDDADAASSVGVNIFKSKLLCFVICAVITAVAGAMFYLNKGTIYPSAGFDIGWTVSIVFIVIIGGIGTMLGPILGAFIYVILEETLSHYPGWSNIILGIIAILVILFLPDGIIGTLQKKLNFEIFSQRRFSEPKAKKKIAAKSE
ncbi:MAG: branched-chain amino acid ABC transporter permease [Parasporobacterium sp.]|nr:branched-chain amino acid ABC transporter permease [Parasporobacterium sp.]